MKYGWIFTKWYIFRAVFAYIYQWYQQFRPGLYFSFVESHLFKQRQCSSFLQRDVSVWALKRKWLNEHLVTFPTPLAAFVQKTCIMTNLPPFWINRCFHSVGKCHQYCPAWSSSRFPLAAAGRDKPKTVEAMLTTFSQKNVTPIANALALTERRKGVQMLVYYGIQCLLLAVTVSQIKSITDPPISL